MFSVCCHGNNYTAMIEFHATHVENLSFFCSFSLFIVVNIGSHGEHSNSKTGDRVDVEENDDDDDDDDAIIGGDKEEHRSAADPGGRGLSFTLIRLFLSILSFQFSVFLRSFLSLVVFH